MSSYTRDRKTELGEELEDLQREEDLETRLDRYRELQSKWRDIHDDLLGEASIADEAIDELRSLVAETENAIADQED